MISDLAQQALIPESKQEGVRLNLPQAQSLRACSGMDMQYGLETERQKVCMKRIWRTRSGINLDRIDNGYDLRCKEHLGVGVLSTAGLSAHLSSFTYSTNIALSSTR